MFGRKDGKEEEEPLEQWRQTLEVEIDRLASLSVADLALEVMTATFEAADPEDDSVMVAGGNLQGSTIYTDVITSRLMEARGISFPLYPEKDKKLQERAYRLVAEALQELEHASLVRAHVHDPIQRGADYVITRRGRAALDRGQVASSLNLASP